MLVLEWEEAMVAPEWAVDAPDLEIYQEIEDLHLTMDHGKPTSITILDMLINAQRIILLNK